MAEMKAKPTEPVMVFQWHITDQCDQRCTHCYIFGENPCKTLYSAPFDRMKEVVDRCMAYTARRHFRLQFAISGGDPLLNPEWKKISESFAALQGKNEMNRKKKHGINPL